MASLLSNRQIKIKSAEENGKAGMPTRVEGW